MFTRVRASWRPSDPLGDTTGCVIYYSTDGSIVTVSVDVSGPDSSEAVLEVLVMDTRYLLSPYYNIYPVKHSHSLYKFI